MGKASRSGSPPRGLLPTARGKGETSREPQELGKATAGSAVPGTTVTRRGWHTNHRASASPRRGAEPRKCPTPTSGPSSPVRVHVPSLKHSGLETRVSPSAFHRVDPEDLTEPLTAALGDVGVPQGHRLMTAGQAPCRRSPCPRAAPQGTSIPPDPSPPIP